LGSLDLPIKGGNYLMSMKTLLIERPGGAFHEFIAGVRTATECPIVHADSIAEGLRHFENGYNNIQIAVCTIERDPNEAIRFVKQIRSLAQQAMVTAPRTFILTTEPQPEWASDTLEKLGAEHLLRGFHDQIFAKLRLVRWQLRSKKSLPTIYITRRHGLVSAVGFRPTSHIADLAIGAKLRELVRYLGLYPTTEHTTRMLADELGVSMQSTKVYVGRLREAANRLYREGKIPCEGKDLFWTETRPGGFVHGLRANVVFIDAEQ
jgi:hypothetical protein